MTTCDVSALAKKVESRIPLMPGVDCSADSTCQLMQRAEFDDRIELYVCGSTTLSPSSLFRGITNLLWARKTIIVGATHSEADRYCAEKQNLYTWRETPSMPLGRRHNRVQSCFAIITCITSAWHKYARRRMKHCLVYAQWKKTF